MTCESEWTTRWSHVHDPYSRCVLEGGQRHSDSDEGKEGQD